MRNKKVFKLESLKDKSTLVKLLAEEDVTVSYQKVPTASFNIVTREVTLPIWKDKSETVMDMMSLHEVGHALYTPVDILEKGAEKKIKHSFLNVLEDVRIEKMIQDKYMGSIGVFKKAYKELISKDFFGVQDKELSKLNLIDRINMHYKNVPDVPFDDDELVWVKKSNQTKTSDDVINLAVELQEFMKESEKENESDKEFEVESAMSSNGLDGEDSEEEMKDQQTSWPERPDMSADDDKEKPDSTTPAMENQEDDSEDKEDEKEVQLNTSVTGKGSEDDAGEGISATTDTNYQKKQFESVDPDAKEINYLNIPKISLEHAIIDYKEINNELSTFYAQRVKGNSESKSWFDWIQRDIVRFKKEQKQTVSYMVKEFEMKKTADLYKRSTVSKTGSLNMDKLHSYAYNEDIFLKMNVEPGATSHGLVMFVDWSGSMQENFYNTIKQTLNLVWFCERVNIPFEVYGFTNYYSYDRDDTTKNTKIQKRKQNDMIINELRLLNMLSSRASKKDMEEGLTNLWAYANYYGDNYSQTNTRNTESVYPIYIPSNYQLGSTPLNHSIVAAMDLVPKFKKDNGVQKVHTVFLTDGFSNTIGSKYNWSMSDDRMPSEKYDGDENLIPLPDDYQGYMTTAPIERYSDVKTIITDSVTNKKHICKDGRFTYQGQTLVLLEFLKAREPDMSVTNFFIAGSNRKGTIARSDIMSIFGLRWEDEDKAKAIQKEIKKNNVAVCTNQGWDEMYVLPGGEKLDISDDDMSEIKPGFAKKGDLKKAFSKMTSGRKNSRPLLNKFIGMIA